MAKVLCCLGVVSSVHAQSALSLDAVLPQLPASMIDVDSRSAAARRKEGKPACAVGMQIPYYGGAKVMAANPQDGLYQVFVERDKNTEWLKPAMLSLAGCAAPEAQLITAAWFVGRWDIQIGGETGWRKAGPGDDDWRVGMTDLRRLPPLTIKADGTYSWVLGQNQVINGRWRLSRPEEVPRSTDNTQVGITLEKADDGADWAVIRDVDTVNGNGRAGLLIQRRNAALYFRARRQ